MRRKGQFPEPHRLGVMDICTPAAEAEVSLMVKCHFSLNSEFYVSRTEQKQPCLSKVVPVK